MAKELPGLNITITIGTTSLVTNSLYLALSGPTIHNRMMHPENRGKEGIALVDAFNTCVKTPHTHACVV